MTEETAGMILVTLNSIGDVVRREPDAVREAIDSMTPLQLGLLRTTAQVLEDEVERAEAVIDELDRVTVFDTRPTRLTFEVPEESASAIRDLIDAAIAERVRQEDMAIARMLPLCAQRGMGIAVVTDAAGSWRVQSDLEMPAWTIARRAVDVLPPLAGEERSTDAG